MLDKTWLNEALGIDDESPAPARPSDSNTTTSIDSVVEGFLKNEDGFSREDVARYINEALQNEADDLWQRRVDGVQTAVGWQAVAERAVHDLDPVRAVEAEHKRDEMMEAVSGRYARARTQLGEAIYKLQRTKKVLLSPETCEWVLKLDHDGLLSRSIGVDVEEMFGASADVMPPVRREKKPRTVDFSREAASGAGASSSDQERPLQRDPNGPLAGALRAAEVSDDAPLSRARKQRTNLRELRRVGDSVSNVFASLKQYHPTEISDEPQRPVAEPELA
jgi:hypothetical protein